LYSFCLLIDGTERSLVWSTKNDVVEKNAGQARTAGSHRIRITRDRNAAAAATAEPGRNAENLRSKRRQ